MTSPLYQLSVQKYLPHFPDTKEFYVWRHQFEFKGWCHLMRPNRLECCFFIIKAKKSDSEWREWKSAFLHYFQKTNNGKYFFYDETIGTRTIQHFIIEWLVEYSKIMTHSSSWQIMLFCNGRYHRSLFEYFAWCLYVCLLIPSQQCKMQSRKICSSDQAQIWVWSSYQHSRYCMCHGFGYLVSHFLFYFVDYILIMCYFPPDVI